MKILIILVSFLIGIIVGVVCITKIACDKYPVEAKAMLKKKK